MRVEAVLATAALLLGTAPTPVVVDGTPLPASALATIEGKAYVALHAIGSALGAEVGFDAKSRRATLTTEFREAVFVVDDVKAIVDGRPRRLDAAPKLVGGRVLIPLRALATALGATVRYERASHSVIVSTSGVLSLPQSGVAAPPASSTETLEGTVTEVRADMVPPAVAVEVEHLTYTITIPEGTKIQFRDTHGGTTGSGSLSQVRPGDTLIATLDAGGHIISAADIFSGFGGTIASVAGSSLVLTNGRVVEADAARTTVTLDGRPAAFGDLRAGDLVSVRADPRTGKVRGLVALTPGGAAAATATPAAGAGLEPVRIADVTDDATHALRVGQTLHVGLDGTPGGSATFDLSNVVIGLPMREVRPGRYEGSYAVGVGTNLIDAPIIVHLTKSGQTAQAEARDPLAIITTPPSVNDAKPDPGAEVNNVRPNIYATFSSIGDRGVDAQSLKLVVNGKDVTAAATRTSSFVSYLPPTDLEAGRVTVEVSGADTAGNPLYYRWTFVIVR